MREIMQNPVDLDADAAHTIAAGMRAVARADGTHPKEEALINAFEADLPPGPTEVDLSTLRDAAHKEAFLKSLVLVAYADGKVSDAERGVIEGYAAALGADTPSLTRVFADVASSLLSRFSGVQIWRHEVNEIGRQMGLADAAIEQALASDPQDD